MRILLITTVLLAGCAGAPPAPTPTGVAVDLRAETLDGDELDLRGQPVALVWWQSW